jgi:hypothetical protein
MSYSDRARIRVNQEKKNYIQKVSGERSIEMVSWR